MKASFWLGSEVTKFFSIRRLLPFHSIMSNRFLVLLWRSCLRLSSVHHLIEAGANRAEISKSFCKVLSFRSAWAFEANPQVFNDFTSLNIPNNMKVFNLGLGSGAPQKMILKVPRQNRSRYSGNGSFLEQVNPNEYDEYEVQMSSIDDVVQKNGLKGNFALWIDVEGFTYNVLLGSFRALQSKQISYIFLEMESRHYWKYGADAKSMDNFLRNFGYKRLARDYEFTGQFNAIYTNRKNNLLIYLLTSIYNIFEKIILLISVLQLPIVIFVKILKKLALIKRVN